MGCIRRVIVGSMGLMELCMCNDMGEIFLLE